MKSTALKERLNANQMCERRDEIVAKLTQAMECLSEADLLLKTLTTHGFAFDRNTFYSPSEPASKMRTLGILTKQTDRKIWDHIVELGQFRDLMTVKEQRRIYEELEACPPVTIDTVTATFASLLSNRPNMLHDLVETAFLERSSGYKSNAGNKINKRQVINGVYCKYGFANWGSRPCDRMDDLVKACSLLTGLEAPHVVNVLKEQDELVCFSGAVKFKAYNNGNVHMWILDKTLLDKLNDVLAGAMGAKLGE